MRPAAGRILDQLHGASSWAARFAVLDACLGRWAAAPGAGHPIVASAWDQLRRSGGTLAVEQLASDSGCSQRYLAKVFQAELGLTPKVAGRVIRFDTARRRLLRGGVALAAAAAAAGYYDQAHLDRDFRQFAGCSPTRWLATEFRNVQDTGAAVARG
jgi:AraC-like DNA-binding protein